MVPGLMRRLLRDRFHACGVYLREPTAGILTAGIEVEQLDYERYRITEVPSQIFDFVGYQDIAELVPCPGGMHELSAIKVPGGWRRFDFVVSRAHAESDTCAAVLARAVEMGGLWVRDVGGLLSILLPPHSVWDPTEELFKNR